MHPSIHPSILWENTVSIILNWLGQLLPHWDGAKQGNRVQPSSKMFASSSASKNCFPVVHPKGPSTTTSCETGPSHGEVFLKHFFHPLLGHIFIWHPAMIIKHGRPRRSIYFLWQPFLMSPRFSLSLGCSQSSEWIPAQTRSVYSPDQSVSLQPAEHKGRGWPAIWPR